MSVPQLSVPPLQAGVCQVWWARLGSAHPALADVLNDVERGRHAAYHRAADRDRFLLGCALVRHIVAAQLAIAPADVPLDRTCSRCGKPHGKVRVTGATPPIEVSVSHSGDLVAVAFHTSDAVGIDVEAVRPTLHHDDLPVLTDAESRALHRVAPPGCDPTARAMAFLAYWTRKEAIVKATGDGIAIRLTNIEVSAPDEPPRLLRWTDRPDLPSRIHLHTLHPDPLHAAALATLTETPTAVHEHDATPLLAASS